jgi:hypothetical protein
MPGRPIVDLCHALGDLFHAQPQLRRLDHLNLVAETEDPAEHFPVAFEAQ